MQGRSICEYGKLTVVVAKPSLLPVLAAQAPELVEPPPVVGGELAGGPAGLDGCVAGAEEVGCGSAGLDGCAEEAGCGSDLAGGLPAGWPPVDGRHWE